MTIRITWELGENERMCGRAGGNMLCLNDKNSIFQWRTHKTSPQELKVSQSKTVRNQTITSLSLFPYSNPFCVANSVILNDIFQFVRQFSSQTNCISANLHRKNTKFSFSKNVYTFFHLEMFAIIANILLASELHDSENKIFSDPFLFFKELAEVFKKKKNQSRNCRSYCLAHTDWGFTVTSHSPNNTTDISQYFSTRPEKSTNVMKEYYKQLISILSWCPCRCYWPMLTALFHSYFVVSFTQRILQLNTLQLKSSGWNLTQLHNPNESIQLICKLQREYPDPTYSLHTANLSSYP